MKTRLTSLRTQIVAWSFVPTAIILLAVALVAFAAYSQVTGDLVIQQSQELTRLSANQFATELREYADTLATSARGLSSAIGDRVALRQELAELGDRLSVFDGGVVVLDNYGKVIGAQPTRADILGRDWSDRSYFADLIRGEAAAYSDVLPDGPDGRSTIAIAVPVLGDRGETFGVMAGLFRIGLDATGSLYGSIVKLRNGLASESFVVDSAGTILYHFIPDQIGASATGHPALPLVQRGESGSYRTRSRAGDEIVTSYAPVPGTSWAVIRETSWAALLAPSSSYRQFLIILLALGFIIPALVTAWGVRSITRSIQRLTRAAQDVGNGQFGQTIDAAPTSELQELVTQFNGMSTRLGESYEKLRARNEQFELVMQGNNDGIWDWNVRTGEVRYSDRWKSMLGYAPDEIADHIDSWVELIHPDDLNRVQEFLQTYLQGGVAVYQVEHRLRHKDGSYRWILARGQALKDEAGRVYRIAGSHTDISELKRVQGILRGQRQFLEALTAGADLQETLRGLALSVEENWPTARVTIWLQDEATGLLKVTAHGSLPDAYVAVLEELQSGVGASAPSTMALRTRQRVIVEDVKTDPRWDLIPHVRELAMQHDLHAAWLEPITSSAGVPLGTFSIYHVEPRRATEDEGQLIQTSAHLVGVAVESRRAEQDLQAAQAQLQSAYVDLERRIQQRTRALVALNTIAGVVSRSLDLHAVLRDALDVCTQLIGVETGAVYVVDDAANTFVMYAQHHLSPEFASLIALVPVVPDPLALLTNSEEPFSMDAAAFPAPSLRAGLVREGLESVITVPLRAKDKLVGALVLGVRQARTLAPEEVSLLTAIGRQIGVAVENGRLYEAEQARRDEAERRRRVAEGLGEILAVLNSRQSLQETLQFIAEQACRVLGAGGSALMRLDERDGLLRVQASCGLDAEFVANLRFKVGVAAAGRALEQRKPMVVPDTWIFLDAIRGRDEWPAGVNEPTVERVVSKFRAMLSVPLLVQDQPYGAITLYYPASRTFSQEDISLAQTVADQAAIAIESARLRQQAEESAAVAERNRLARELHDSVTQNLYSVTLYAEAAARLLKNGATDQAADHMRELRDTAQEALREMRLLIFELRPVDLQKSGLVGALQARLQAVETRGGMQAELHQEGVEYAALLALPVQEELYHIAQEALNNALKHSGAQRVHVTLTYGPQNTRLEVADNGRGFDLAVAAENGGMGLRGMRERVQRIGGELELASALGQGTHISVVAPTAGASDQ